MEVVEMKDEKSISKLVKKYTNLMVTQDDPMFNIVGSFILKSRLIWGDIDGQEIVISDERTLENNVEDFKKGILNALLKILSDNESIFSDLKFGFDTRFFIKKIKKQPTPTDVKDVKQLFEDRLITKKEFNSLVKLDKNDQDEIIRNMYTLRWSPGQMLDDFQINRKKKIFVNNALKQNSTVKIDQFVPYRGKMIEASNFMVLGRLIKKGTKILIEILNPLNEPLEDIMRKDVKKFIKQEKFFKAIKRTFAVTQLLLKKNKIKKIMIPIVIDNLERITRFLNSKVGTLGQLVNEYDDLLRIFEIKRNIPFDFIKKQINTSRDRLANALSKKEMKKVNIILNENSPIIKMVKSLQKILIPILKKASRIFYDTL